MPLLAEASGSLLKNKAAYEQTGWFGIVDEKNAGGHGWALKEMGIMCCYGLGMHQLASMSVDLGSHEVKARLPLRNLLLSVHLIQNDIWMLYWFCGTPITVIWPILRALLTKIKFALDLKRIPVR